MRVFSSLVVGAAAQQVGTQKAESHLPMSLATCTASGCETAQKSVVLDANWRWTHNTGGYQNCYTGHDWDASFCPDPKTCAENCAVDGVPMDQWSNPYGVSTTDGGLKLNLVTQGQYGKNVGTRLYLLDEDESYVQFKLKNREFTFDVDVSSLPCGVNGAVYFVQMDADGGSSRFPANKAGAKYGTGYCDAQCPHDIKFINGEANIVDWDDKTQHGKYGTCCTEMDIWEANSMASAYTPHTCDVKEQTRCESAEECGDKDRYSGHCDKDGCDLNPFRFGVEDFFGEGLTLDSSKPMTVVTQFITSDGTDTGDLVEIRRKYVQDGKVIETPDVTAGGKKFNSITDEFCEASKKDFGDQNAFAQKGGLKSMGEAMEKGMTLVMSIWDDSAAYMLWLDSSFPATKDPKAPGVTRGKCPSTGGRPDDVEAKNPDAHALYTNLKFGPIGSTVPTGPSPAPAPPSPTPPSPTPPSPTPGPSGCPGGSLEACMGLCPAASAAYKACVETCTTRCTSETLVI